MSAEIIFYPVAVLVFWTLMVLVLMGSARVKAVKKGEVPASYFRDYQGEVPERLAVAERHFRNMLELPPLFYLACVVTYMTGNVDGWMVGLAWAFVILRLAHSGVHLGGNVVNTRFFVFLLGLAVLASMWLVILARL